MFDYISYEQSCRDRSLSVDIAKEVKSLGGSTYYVGGYCRDAYIGFGTTNKDIDIEIYGISLEQLRNILDSFGERLEHGKSFGVFGIKGYNLDISLPRKERCTGINHTDFDITVDPSMSTYEGALRRDLTMNSLMIDVLTGELVDHFGGLSDIKSGIIRHVNSETFKEDPLRVLRVAQFAARFNMNVAPETLQLCRSMDISTLSKERIFTELEKGLLKSDKPSTFFNVLRDMGQLSYWFFELEQLIGLAQNEQYHPEGDVYTHTMMVLDNTTETSKNDIYSRIGLALAAVCHDFGKIVTTEKINGVTHSYKHELFGEDIARTFLNRFTNDKKLIEYVCNMTKLHMTPHQLYNNKSRIKKTNKLFDESLYPKDLIYLACCDSFGRDKEKFTVWTDPAIDELKWLLDRYDIFVNMMSKPYVTGQDLVDSGLTPGPHFSELLGFAHKLRLAGVDKDSTLRQVLVLSRKFK